MGDDIERNARASSRAAGVGSGPGARAALYARVSTAEQAASLDQQTDELSQLAARRGWQVVALEREVGSGARDRRPGRYRLIEWARRGRLDVIAVVRLDRWGRSTADALATLAELDHVGCALVSVREALDLGSAAGRAMAAMLAVFAQFEREVRAERQRAGIARARAEGRTGGAPRTTGLRRDEIVARAAAGATPAAIARELMIPRRTVRRYWPTADRLEELRAGARTDT